MCANILVVDDERDLAELIQQKFRKKIRNNEYAFTFAYDGLEALALLNQNNEIDMVLTDINMPKMDGLTLLSRVNENFPLLKSVIVSAYGDMQNIRTALNRGAFDFVTKPIDFQDLEITINKTLSETQASKQAHKDRDTLLAFEQELDVAKRIQESMLPRTFPAFPEHDEFDIHARMIPAKHVGGDLYDFFMVDDENLGFVVGDVSGKGVPAAIFMAVCKTIIKSMALKTNLPGACLEQVNQILFYESVPNVFITAFYGLLNIKTGRLSYCNGGHNCGYILRGDGSIESTGVADGIPLSYLENFSYSTTETTLKSGDSIFLYSDGVTEAMDSSENEFSESRLEKVLVRHADKTPELTITKIEEALNQFTLEEPQSDDITMLAVKYS